MKSKRKPTKSSDVDKIDSKMRRSETGKSHRKTKFKPGSTVEMQKVTSSNGKKRERYCKIANSAFPILRTKYLSAACATSEV